MVIAWSGVVVVSGLGKWKHGDSGVRTRSHPHHSACVALPETIPGWEGHDPFVQAVCGEGDETQSCEKAQLVVACIGDQGAAGH
jgi:hypothetical protein